MIRTRKGTIPEGSQFGIVSIDHGALPNRISQYRNWNLGLHKKYPLWFLINLGRCPVLEDKIIESFEDPPVTMIQKMKWYHMMYFSSLRSQVGMWKSLDNFIPTFPCRRIFRIVLLFLCLLWSDDGAVFEVTVVEVDTVDNRLHLAAFVFSLQLAFEC